MADRLRLAGAAQPRRTDGAARTGHQPSLSHPLRSRSFRLVLAGRTATTLSDSLMPVALTLAVVQATDSAADLAWVLLAAVGARLVLLPLAGVLVDRWDVRRSLLIADITRGVVQAFVAAQLFSEHLNLVAIAAAELVSGAASAIALSGQSPLIAGVVGASEDRRRANALMGAGRSTAQLLGPLIAGALVLTAGAGWVFVLDSAAFVLGAATLFGIQIEHAATGHESRRGSLRTDLIAGWAEVRSRDWYLGSLFAHASVNFADIVLVTLGPLVASRHQGGRTVWVAVVEAGGIGLFVGSVFAGRFRPSRPILVGNLVLAGCAAPTMMFALWTPIPLLVGAYAVSWAAMGLVNPVWDTTVQARIPPDVLARVSSYDWLMSLTAQPIALLIIPVAAAGWGTTAPLIGTAALVVVCCGGTALVPGVRALRADTPTPASETVRE